MMTMASAFLCMLVYVNVCAYVARELRFYRHLSPTVHVGMCACVRARKRACVRAWGASVQPASLEASGKEGGVIYVNNPLPKRQHDKP